MGYDQHQRDTVDLGGGIVREYFPERVRRQDRAPVARKMDKRDPCPRRSLARHIDASTCSYAALSRMLQKPDHYLRRFVLHGTPTMLHADDHRRLADFFGVDERALGVRDLWKDAA